MHASSTPPVQGTLRRPPQGPGRPLARRSSLGSRVSRRLRAVPLVAALFALLAAPSCDNVACVFSEAGCVNQNSSGGIGSQPATRLSTADWVRPAAPTVTRMLPSADAHPETPIVVEFSESMAADSVRGAFEILESGGFAGLPLTSTLTGDGRLAVLSSVTALDEGATYQVLYAEDAQLYDLTGQTLSIPEDRVVGEFTVAETPSDEPSLLTSFPADGATSASALSTIVAVFDRPMDASSINVTSFRVTVDGGAPPTNTGPVVLQATVGMGASAPDPRVVLWRAQNALGDRLSFGDDASVQVSLSSPGGAGQIEDEDMNPLPETSFGFTTSRVPAPSGAQILSTPNDAIGIANLDGTTPLSMQVDLAVPAADGDTLEIYLVGRDLQNDEDDLPRNAALIRTFPLSGGAVSVLLSEAELRLARTTSPVTGVFQDGDVTFAFAVVSGAIRTPVRVLDVDAAGADVVDPVLDTTAPSLVELGHFGEQVSEFRSDLRDLVVNGVANEELRSVEVRTQIGLVVFDNGTFPDVASFDATTGRFLAQPVTLGLVDAADLPATLEVTLYDAALNASDTTMVPFYQLGASGPGAALPGPDVTVTVFDARSLLPVAGAQVFTHEDDGGVYTAVATATTDMQGRASLASAIVGETIVSVDATGYDLFSFHGAPTARLDVPLHATGAGTAVVAAGLGANFEEISLLDNLIYDSRVPFPFSGLSSATSCFFNPFTEQTGCVFDAYGAEARRLGALTSFSVNEPANEGLYSAESFLRAFVWEAPRPGLEPGSTASPALIVDQLLAAVTTPPEDRAIDAPLQVLDVAGATGVDTGALDGPPTVRLEGLAPGLPNAPAVGLGVAFDQGGGVYNLRAAYPGVVDGILGGGGDQLGALVESGALDGDHFFVAEIADTDGNRSGTRRRLTLATGTLELSPVPVITAPVGATGGPSFDVVFDDVIPDALGQEGIYRLIVADSAGRAWRLWRFDPPDANGPSVTIHLPDIGLGGGAPLADGALAATVTSYSLPAPPGTLTYGGFDRDAFAWTEIEVQRDRRSVGEPVLWTQP